MKLKRLFIETDLKTRQLERLDATGDPQAKEKLDRALERSLSRRGIGENDKYWWGLHEYYSWRNDGPNDSGGKEYRKEFGTELNSGNATNLKEISDLYWVREGTMHHHSNITGKQVDSLWGLPIYDNVGVSTSRPNVRRYEEYYLKIEHINGNKLTDEERKEFCQLVNCVLAGWGRCGK